MTPARCQDVELSSRRVPGGTYIFTVDPLERRRCLRVEHILLLLDVFRMTRWARPFDILAIAVMPDHLHCVWRLPDGDADNARRWAHIKAVFSRGLPIDERRSPQRVARRERGIWQRRYWEHLVRDDDDLRRVVDYVHINPVKHGYVARAADWPYSSFRRWVSMGVYPLDWAAEPATLDEMGER